MKTISEFKDIHNSKRCFILASGPSLKTHDLSRLKNRLVIGLNRSFLIYPETHYHCTMDKRLYELYPDFFDKTRYLFTIPTFPIGIPLNLLGAEEFSFDLEKGIFSGYTITYFSLQLAVYMGFKEIFFVGLDLKHQQGDTHFFGFCHHSRQHEATEFPKMEKMLSYGAKILKDKGIKVYNCSPVSTLTCFQKADFDWAVSL